MTVLRLALFGLGVLFVFYSSPGGAQTGVPVSADSILATARVLSGETGFPRNRMAVRESTTVFAGYLRDRLDAVLAPLGGSAVLASFDTGLPDVGPVPIRTRFSNVVGIVPGADPGNGTFILGGHWDATSEREAVNDTTWDPMTALAPGADDNGSGVAAVLEALRVAAARGIRPQADLIVAFLDGEERQFVYDPDEDGYVFSGEFLLGAGHLSDSLAVSGREIYGFVNADMIAYNPRVDSLVVITNIPSRWLADQLVSVVDTPNGWADDLILTRLVRGLTFSDHGPFWEEGFDAVLIIEAAQIQDHASGHYHLETDTVDRTYSRSGSQVAAAAEALVGLLETWSWSAADMEPVPVVTAEDILVQDAISIDLSKVHAGEEVEIQVGFTNRGGTFDGTWSIELASEDLDGRRLRVLGLESFDQTVPAGGRVKVKFPWVPSRSERGAIRLHAEVGFENDRTQANRVVAVEGSPSEVSLAFVYPNPTRDPGRAAVRYALTRTGAVRLTVLDLRGNQLAERDELLDPVVPGETVDPGLAEVPLGDVLGNVTLAPGLYILRVELFQEGGGTADVLLTKFAVLR